MWALKGIEHHSHFFALFLFQEKWKILLETSKIRKNSNEISSKAFLSKSFGQIEFL